jgi:HK97 family phage major capsid protein
MKTTATYNNAFWNTMRGKNDRPTDMREGGNSSGYVVPSDFNDKYLKTLEKENVFRRLATTIDSSTSEGTINVINTTGSAQWIKAMTAIPENTDGFKQIPADSHKLAALSKIKNSFIGDNNFNIEAYLENEFSRRFGRAEENAFINGTGIDAPTGILHATGGGEVGVTTEEDVDLSYDDVIKLYFSLKPEHRRNAVWLMNDETAFYLRTLKDANGNYLYNSVDDTILGKPVHYSNYMPTIESGKSPIAFGDLSFYWIIQRQPLTIARITELYAVNNEIGFLGFERLDGRLIIPEAVKLIRMA